LTEVKRRHALQIKGGEMSTKTGLAVNDHSLVKLGQKGTNAGSLKKRSGNLFGEGGKVLPRGKILNQGEHCRTNSIQGQLGPDAEKIPRLKKE